MSVSILFLYAASTSSNVAAVVMLGESVCTGLCDPVLPTLPVLGNNQFASFTQPVYYEFKDLQMPTLLLIGTSDTTAIGKDLAPPAVKAKIGHYEVLGKQVAKLIPHATLVEFPGLGHAPQMEEPAQFHKALLQGLNGL